MTRPRRVLSSIAVASAAAILDSAAATAHSGEFGLFVEPHSSWPGGAVAVWSAARAPGLLETIGEVFARVEESAHAVRLQDRDEQYWLYVARVS